MITLIYEKWKPEVGRMASADISAMEADPEMVSMYSVTN